MRILLLGFVMVVGCLAAQVLPPDKPAQSGLPAGDLQPDTHGAYKPGGAVSLPKLMHQVEPRYSKLAKKKKIEGHVIVSLIVDETGKPQDVHVKQGLGYGLDEEAVTAVRAWSFEPSRLNNKPVSIAMDVDVNFRVF